MVTAPATVLLLLVVLGTTMLALGTGRWIRLGHWCVGMGSVLLLICGVLPVGTLLLRPLENRFPPPTDLAAPTGILVLGGSSDEKISAARGRVTIVDAADRVTEAVILARRYPEARLVFTGGSASLAPGDITEADDTRSIWIALGVNPDRITTESQSRNTDENARFTADLVKPKPGESWLLVTSAYHMPRAVGLFRANGFPVIPYPVDYRSRDTAADFSPSLDVANGLARFNMAVREWIGLVAYRLSGRTDDLFPGP
jgi:uncharacterized SAM-binding protein YcdF (DUF218 family)